MTYTFKDYYHNEVELSFDKEPFSTFPKHVWVVCKYKNQWLLTKHRTRGLEFPGGKVESGESAEDAAKREVWEETGGIVQELTYLAQYYVDGKRDYIIKNVYFAKIESLQYREDYLETLGPVLLKEIPGDIKQNRQYSFMMKDDVLVHCLARLSK
ncbi:MAG TPA: nucleoside triphosphatase YtkD [Pseudogracilibacillus sp.]|nr:nucleoside triphosphatase YtkD [Pseudogracilibacillus sp.]